MEHAESSPSNDRPRRTKKKPLVMRLYFQPHLTELVQLIGYAGLPAVEAQQRIQELVKKHGAEKMADAAVELLHIDHTVSPPMARLTQHVRKIAYQMLGPPPESPWADAHVEPAPPVPARSLKPPRIDRVNISNGPSPSPGRKPVLQPRTIVAPKFQEWLGASGLTYVPLEQVQRAAPSLKTLGTLDFIVQKDGKRLLVTVRKSLTAKQRAEMAAWQEAYGPDFQAVRTWPAEGPDGWVWPMVALSEPRDSAT